MAHTDMLTGLPNRRALEDWAGRQLRGAARHGFPFWVVAGDLDSFEDINDGYGHDAGDAVLQKFAEILKGNYARVGHLRADGRRRIYAGDHARRG